MGILVNHVLSSTSSVSMFYMVGQKAFAMFFSIITFGSISLCVSDYFDGGVLKAAAVALNPVQKLNDMINHVPGVQTLPGSPGSGHTQSMSNQKTPCTCGVFLSSQITKGSSKQPTGYAALVNEQDEPAACNALGVKACTNKCLEIIAKHLPNSPAIICGSVDRDVYKERAHLFVKNCNDFWINTLLSTGKEYCCKDDHYYKCPML
ncbi:follicle cell protein 3C-1 [Sipha flava]|uniref:Follicle cell protein 3C-1 n=2 Tax=Sipha flava TaxID=143950 RepID=A0A8B8GAR2_9HEMI|nr:follicle cell protein 3C-1 [Sipha flava]XP_025419993.1 follicle cell protein 3C-1 [Sipha flava]